MVDIARLAGVSLATASRALSNAPGVAPATRERVLAVAEELSYVVSPEASRLSGGPTRRVAVVVPHISRWFFAAMLEAVESVLREADLDLLLYHVGDAADRQAFFERLPARRKVDAVVVLAFPVSEAEQQRLELMGVSIVAAGGQSADYPYVCIDDEAAGLASDGPPDLPRPPAHRHDRRGRPRPARLARHLRPRAGLLLGSAGSGHCR